MFVDVDETTGTWYAWENERKARRGNFHAPRGSGDTPNEARENLKFILDAADRRQEWEAKQNTEDFLRACYKIFGSAAS